MRQYRIWAALSAAAVMAAVVPVPAEAAGSYEMRQKAIRLSGIMGASTEGEYVTRGEFAQMLVAASSYKSLASQSSNVSVYQDVPASSPYASAVRIAADNGWMTGYLGGQFRPDQQITLQEAARGLLGLLGYTDEDFAGDQLGGRWSQYLYLDLGESVSKEAQEILTGKDCVNLFYNLLCAKTKGGTAYASTLGYEMTSDGQVNVMTMADSSLKGPFVVKSSESLDDYIPFDVNEASFYMDGEFSTLERVKQEKQSEGFVVIYYNTANKTVWTYTSATAGEDTNSAKVAIKGRVSGIFYGSTDVMTPTTVTLEEDESLQFALGNSDVQFQFSIYGEFEVGDMVLLICEATKNVDGDYSYKVIDCVDY